jgi:ABC-type transporter Mla MlaB component
MATPQRRTTIVCDVGALAGADIATVAALARLALVLRRHGLQICLHGVSDDLRELLVFVGVYDALCVEAGGQAEQREQRLGVEEERDFDDPPV